MAITIPAIAEVASPLDWVPGPAVVPLEAPEGPTDEDVLEGAEVVVLFVIATICDDLPELST